MGRGDGDFWTHYESVVDEQIRKATEAGAFDDLPGAGKPLGLPTRDDENWWIREKLRREGVSTDVLLPLSLQLRKEVARLPETVRDLPDEAAVRAVAEDLDRRVLRWLRTPSGPRVPIRRVSVDAVVDAWRASRPRPSRPTPVPSPARPASPAPRRSWRRLFGR